MAKRSAESKKESTGGELSDYPNDKWKVFIEKSLEAEILPPDQWKPVHVLGYFCKKYFDAYQVKYQLKFNSPSPTKSFEVYQIKKLAMALSADPVILKEYIDWIYEIKVAKGKRRLTSISFMTVDALVNDYKFNVLLGKKKQLQVDRSTLLPREIKEIFKAIDYVRSYGDLVFVYRTLENNSDNSQVSPDLVAAIAALKTSDFDFSILERIV